MGANTDTMISIVIPLYNKERTIGRAVTSVLAQTYHDYTIIIVDDGSTDNSASIVNQLNDAPIRLISQSNQGVSAARNRGIAESTSEWIAFLDADDEWHPNLLEEYTRLATLYPQCNVVASAYGYRDATGKYKSLTLNRLPFEGTNGILSNYFDVAAHSNPPICSSSIMVRKQSLLAIGGFPTGIRQGEDLLTWAKLAIHNQIAYTTQCLSTFYPERVSYYGQPSRIPESNDPVGYELEKLLNNHPNISGLRSYVGHWHKMRASIFLRLPGYRSHATNEITQAMRYLSDHRKLHLYKSLLLLPYKIRMKLFETIG